MLDEATKGPAGSESSPWWILLYSVSSATAAFVTVETANERAIPITLPQNKLLDIGITLVTLPAALIFVALALSTILARVVDDNVFLSWAPTTSADRWAYSPLP